MYVRPRRLGADEGSGTEGPGFSGGGEGGDTGEGHSTYGSGGGPVAPGFSAGDFSPDVRGDDPFSGRPTGPFSGFDPTPTAPTTRTAPAASPLDFNVTLGIPGFAAVSFSRDRIGVSFLGVGISVSTKGISFGGGPTTAAGPHGPGYGAGEEASSGLPGSGQDRSAESGRGAGGHEGGAGSPGGADWPVPSLPGLPPLAIVTPGPGGSPGSGLAGTTAGLGAVTIPWLWIGTAAGLALLSRQGKPGRRR